MTHDELTTPPGEILPIEEIAHYPLPGMAIPGSITFSPDDRLIAYLWSEEGSLARQLYAFDPQAEERRLLVETPGEGTTDENVSLAEALRRERQRQRESGVTSYAWTKGQNRLLVPLRGDIYVQDGPDTSLRLILDSSFAQGVPAIDPQFSPDGEWIAYVQDAELDALPFQGGAPRQLTHGARGTGKTNGLAEYIAQEEMGRRHGFWWSPDSASIAFVEADETHIPVYRIVHQGKNGVGPTAQEDHHYPFAGQANARLRLGVVSLAGGQPVWLDLGDPDGIYLARVDWLPDGSLVAHVENREQTSLEIFRFDTQTGQRASLLRETNPVWINLHSIFSPLKGENGHSFTGFLWASERSGYRHLYLYDSDGKLIRQLTSGNWMVEELAGVDQDRRLAYFTATRQTPLERHLYSVSLAGGEVRRLTQVAGIHSVILDHACRRFVDIHQALDSPPVVRLCSLETGDPLVTIYDNPDSRLQRLALQPPELVEIKNRHGDLLYAAVYRPPARFGPSPFPAIVSAYGGPHVQLVSNDWAMTVNMRAQYLCSLGYLVFTLDNRGSARRGLDFESPIKHHLGRLEVEDQVDGVRWLVEHALADPQRVGIYGWSYGGYMAAMCLVRAPETFKVAVAGAPVTAWDGYDTHYTERYMGAPQANPQGYEESSVMHYVQDLRGKLMLVHGLIDENVHFRHTARLINALIQARKPYELLLFPDERHMPRKPADRVYMEERIRDFFLENL